MSVAKPPTYRARKNKATPYKAPKMAAGVTDLATAAQHMGIAPPTVVTPPHQGPIDTQPLQVTTYPKGSAPASGGGAPASSGGSAPVAQTSPPFPSTPVPTGPPPETLAGADQRIDARTGYGTTMGDINSRILQAAMDYGGVNSIDEAGLDPQGHDTMFSAGVTADPNSQVAALGRQLSDDSANLGQNLNNSNSYFSGAHLEQQGRINDQNARDQLAAKTAFDRAYSALLTELANARGSRDSALRAADFADISAASATDPTAEAPVADAPPADGGAATNPDAHPADLLPGSPTVIGQSAQKSTSTPLPPPPRMTAWGHDMFPTLSKQKTAAAKRKKKN